MNAFMFTQIMSKDLVEVGIGKSVVWSICPSFKKLHFYNYIVMLTKPKANRLATLSYYVKDFIKPAPGKELSFESSTKFNVYMSDIRAAIFQIQISANIFV